MITSSWARRRLAGVSLLILVAGVSSLRAAEAEREVDQIRGWSAPPFWLPHAFDSRDASEARSLMSAASIPTTPLAFVAVPPCRLADTRAGSGFTGPYGPPSVISTLPRSFTIAGQCGIPANAAAVSFNFAVTNLTSNGNIIVFPAGGSTPQVSSLNWTPSELAISNAAVVALGAGGAITVLHNGLAANPVDLIIDVNGYYGGNLVTSLNTLTGDVTLAAGSNIGFGTAGNVITINSSGGLTLPFAGTSSDTLLPAFKVSSPGTGIQGIGGLNVGVLGMSQNTSGVRGESTDASGVVGVGGGGSAGVVGFGNVGCCLGVGLGAGVYGYSDLTVGVVGHSKMNASIRGFKAIGDQGLAGLFDGDVNITGTLTKSAGSFRIDHPLDPEHKYLSHSFVESPDMKNVYDGVVEIGERGEAEVVLPDWFEALNESFRYQLTCIGAHAPVYIAREIAGNRFTIGGGTPGMKVSWQVTGTRHDAYAVRHRIPVEEPKAGAEIGSRHPDD